MSETIIGSINWHNDGTEFRRLVRILSRAGSEEPYEVEMADDLTLDEAKDVIRQMAKVIGDAGLYLPREG